MHALCATGGGFLVAVLWFDLMFDVQVLGHPAAATLPESVLASIAAYYRRVTTDGAPMGNLVGVVMLLTLVVAAATVLRAGGGRRGSRRSRRGLPFLALLVGAAPILLAVFWVLPDAVALGARSGTPSVQSALAWSIFRAHVFCLGAMAVFVLLQLRLAALSGRGT